MPGSPTPATVAHRATVLRFASLTVQLGTASDAADTHTRGSCGLCHCCPPERTPASSLWSEDTNVCAVSGWR